MFSDGGDAPALLQLIIIRNLETGRVPYLKYPRYLNLEIIGSPLGLGRYLAASTQDHKQSRSPLLPAATQGGTLPLKLRLRSRAPSCENLIA